MNTYRPHLAREPRYLELPPPLMLQRQDALLLDVDGTLIELASAPDEVVVPPGLVRLLQATEESLDAAVGVVSGRGLEAVDELLKPWKASGAGIHGAEVRLPGTRRIQRPQPLLASIARSLREHFAYLPEVVIEDKGAAVAVHFARCPERARECERALADAVSGMQRIRLQPGRFVIEAVPADSNKGDAVRLLMGHRQFAGRRPVYVGDDETDESAFAAVTGCGGFGVKVGAGSTLARYRLSSPQQVRHWLHLSLGSLRLSDPRL